MSITDMSENLHAKSETVRKLVTRLAADRTSGIVRVRPKVFAYRPRVKAPISEARPAKAGRPPSPATQEVDAAISRVLTYGVWTPATEVIAAVRQALGGRVDPKRITDRLYRRSQGERSDVLTRGEGRERSYSLGSPSEETHESHEKD